MRKPIPVVCGSRNKYISGLYMKRGVNYNNLTQVPLTSIRSLPGKHMLMDCCLLNTRSVRNKAIIVKDYVVENNIDLVGLTETWLKPGVADAAKIEDLKPNGYKLPHEARKKKRAGGVGILHRSNIDIATKESVTFKSFEYMETVLRSPCKSVRVIAVYRPPPSKENRLTCKMFFEDFTVFLEQQTITNGCLLIMGDFNFHVEDVSDSEAMQFLELLNVNNLQQHISQSTHKHGHTLDLVITRKDEDTVHNIHVSQPGISDHSAIHFQLTLDKPGYCRKVITYRK